MAVTTEARGDLTPEVTLIDATSGNTGIGYAMIGAALGYRVRLVLPDAGYKYLSQRFWNGE